MQPASLDSFPTVRHISAVTGLRRGLILGLTAFLAARGLAGQCPDGTPPPCRRPAPAGARLPASIDSTTVLVVPLTPVGADAALRGLASTFAAVVAENMSVGDVRAEVAENLAPVRLDQRAAAAARARAGAVVNGTLIKIGTNVRATVRLVDARTADMVAETTVEGTPDSLLALADRASVVLLSAWWKRQPGPYTRGGVVTTSITGLRHYIRATIAWRRGESQWRALLDSAVRRDPNFLGAWTWLALPPFSSNPMGSLFETMAGPLLAMGGGISSDSAARALPGVWRRQPPTALRELQALPPLSLIAPLAAGEFAPPTPARRQPYSLAALAHPRVDQQYLSALAARFWTLAGYPDTLAVRAARSVASLDSTFYPARSLLFLELVDIGDTASARSLLARRPAFDSATTAELRTTLEQRFREPAQAVADSDLEGLVIAAMLAVPWNRFRLALAAAPSLMRAMEAGAPPPMLAQLRSAITLMVTVPALTALGMQDSARADVETSIRLATSQTSPGVSGEAAVAIGLAAWVPPDPALVSMTFDSSSLDALIASRSAAGRQAGRMPDRSGTAQRMLFNTINQAVWFAGVLAATRGDHRTARAALTILDSAVSSDSNRLLPLALGLRAELALASGDGAAAESLLVQAIATSVIHAPGRYRWLLARHYAATNHPDLAERLAHTLTMPSRLHRRDDAFYYASALKLEAEMLEVQGRLDDAADQYRTYVLVRADADSALQKEVGVVHATLARISVGSRDYAAAWQHVHEAQRRGAAVPVALEAELRRAMPEPNR